MLGKQGGWCMMEWIAGACKEEYMGHSPGNEPLTLMRCTVVSCNSYMKPLRVEVFLWPTLQLRGIKWNISFFIL